MTRLCTWKLPPDSKIGELECVREDLHKGPHWVYIVVDSKGLYIYRVFERRRGLRLVMHARLSGPVTREDVAAFVEFAQVQLTDEV